MSDPIEPMDTTDWPPVRVWLDEAHEHGYALVSSGPNEAVVGMIEWHRCADGEWCGGAVYFDDADPTELARIGSDRSINTWTVTGDRVTGRGLTLIPSIACNSCPNHGFIRDGRWVPA